MIRYRGRSPLQEIADVNGSNYSQFPTYRDSENAVCFWGFGDCSHTSAIGTIADRPFLFSINRKELSPKDIRNLLDIAFQQSPSRWFGGFMLSPFNQPLGGSTLQYAEESGPMETETLCRTTLLFDSF